MKLLLDGEIVDFTPALLAQRVGIGEEAARVRFKQLKEGAIELDWALRPPEYTPDRVYKRDGIVMTSKELSSKVEGLNVNNAGKRLRSWEKGTLDYEGLYYPLNSIYNRRQKNKPTKEWLEFKDKPLKDIVDIPVSEFERKLNNEVDRRNGCAKNTKRR